MKKRLSLVTLLALLLPVLAGCDFANLTAVPNPPALTTPDPAPASVSAELVPAAQKSNYITPEEALALALGDAKLTKDQVQDLEVELDKDDGAIHYDVDFEKDRKEYDYEIDALTGDILRKQVPKAAETAAASTTTVSTNTNSSSASQQISKTEARNIALKHAGLSVSDVRELEVELDRDDGKLHYDVDFESSGYDYDYEIDAATGKILKSHKERD